MVLPTHYDIYLEPNLETFKFEGICEASLHSDESVSKVVMNSLELNYHSIELLTQNKSEEIKDFKLDVENQEIELKLPFKVEGDFRIKFMYTGEHNDKLAGFYRSKYFVDNEERYVVVTQFQANDARRAFPCFDIPGKKATFDIRFLTEKKYMTISNMPIVKEEEKGDKKLVTFDRTPKMSTYLVFFGVGEFDYIEKQHKDKLFRVIASPGKPQKHGQFALDFGIKVVDFDEEYFDQPYPLPKLDQIATPDFAAGAMENWGAILYRENALLHYEGMTSKSQENSILSVIAHEIAHQWFGNLVSPETWKYLWLNESFATFFATRVVDHYYPEKHIFDYFVMDTGLPRGARSTSGVMDWDSMIKTSPIEIEGDAAISFTAKTVPILYSKGGSILRQVEYFLGQDDFRKGLRAYFKKHAFGVTKSNNLWESLEEATGKPIVKMMESWVLQEGIPIVNIVHEGNQLRFSQKRFTYLSSDSKMLWVVPVTLNLYKDNKLLERRKFSFDGQSHTETVPSFDTFTLNEDFSGFYRINYPSDLIASHSELVRNKTINSKDRFGLEDNLFALLKAKKISLDQYLEFADSFSDESSHLGIFSVASHLHYIYDLLEDGEVKEKVKKFGTTFLQKVFSRIGYSPKDDEGMGISIIRGSLLYIAIKMGLEEAKRFALGEFEKLKAGKAVSADLRSVLFAVGAEFTNDYDWLMKQFKSPSSETEFIYSINALCSLSDKNLLEDVMGLVFTDIPSRNRGVAISRLTRNEVVRKDIWEWYIANLDSFEALNNFMFQGAILNVVQQSYEQKEDMEKFFEGYVSKNPRVSDAVDVAFEQLEIRLQFKKFLNS